MLCKRLLYTCVALPYLDILDFSVYSMVLLLLDTPSRLQPSQAPNVLENMNWQCPCMQDHNYMYMYMYVQCICIHV